MVPTLPEQGTPQRCGRSERPNPEIRLQARFQFWEKLGLYKLTKGGPGAKGVKFQPCHCPAGSP